MWITMCYDGYMTCIKAGCNYELDLDGQVTCSVCGAMDDDMCHSDDKQSIFETQVDFE